MRYIIASYRKPESAYGTFLRTGHWPEAVELKSNPNHDLHNGRFTFKAGGSGPAPGARSKAPPAHPKQADGRWGGGGFTDGGGGDFGGAGASGGGWLNSDEVRQFETEHPGKEPYLVQPGDTVESIAAAHHLSAEDLRAINQARPDEKVQRGQVIALPNGKPRTITKNGYAYDLDSVDRTRKAEGDLYLAKQSERSKASQKGAGGADRLASDDGGHFIAARFGGPTDSFNHFAQDASFNRGEYRALEDTWAGAVRSGKKVHVTISAHYTGASRRPDAITVRWLTDGRSSKHTFNNRSKGK